jgi:hypothetical protein
MQGVADHFGWLIARARGPVVFYIDDLDRCSDSYVVELLDTIQTLIRDVAPVLSRGPARRQVAAYFVVAADGCWIRRSYEIVYEKFGQVVAEPGRPLGYLFLDKLFQLRVPVPSMSNYRQHEYLRQLLKVRDVPSSPSQLDVEEKRTRERLKQSSTEAEVVQAMAQASPQVRERVAGSAVERLTAPKVQAATEHSLQRFSRLLPANPRSMKRFVNVYSVLRAVRTLEGIMVQTEPLAQWTILETRWPGLADYLRSKPEAVELLGRPAIELMTVPAELRDLFADRSIADLVSFGDNGPLTAELVRACCGATTEDEA